MKKPSAPTHQIHVAIIDPDPLRHAGFSALLDSYDDLKISALTLQEVGSAPRVDVVLLGKLQNQTSSQVVRYLHGVRPGLRVIVVAASMDDESVIAALADGAKGYVDEASPAQEFVNAVRIVDQGLVWASRRLLAMFVDRANRLTKRPMGSVELTAREKDVLEMLVMGRSNKEIANPLGIEERTVKAHVAKLMRKLGAQNRITLSVHALTHSLVAPR